MVVEYFVIYQNK